MTLFQRSNAISTKMKNMCPHTAFIHAVLLRMVQYLVFVYCFFFFFSRMLSLTNYRYDLLFSWESAHLFMIIHLRNVFTWCTPFEQHVSALFGLCFNDFDAPPWDTILTNIQFLFLIYFFSVSLKFKIFMIFDRMILYHKKVPQRMEHSRIFN